jgi:hypothetical protein
VTSFERFVGQAARKVGLQISRVSSDLARLPVEATARDIELINSLKPFTMTSSERLWSLINAVRHVVDNRIPGDFVECGVWRGGSVMAMATELSSLGIQERRIWLYDTFSGMTAPTSADIEAGTGVSAAAMLESTVVADGDNVWCVAGLEDVTANVCSTGYPKGNFEFVEGDVTQTLHQVYPEKISLLRLDTDWYESTRVELEVLYPRLSVGGVCIFDDYGHWQGARKAVDEYFEKLGHRPYMHPIDYSGRVLIKSQPVGKV